MNPGAALHFERDKVAGFTAALVLHLLASYCVWHYQAQPQPSEAPAVMVSLVNLVAPLEVAAPAAKKALPVRQETAKDVATLAPKPVPAKVASAQPVTRVAQKSEPVSHETPNPLAASQPSASATPVSSPAAPLPRPTVKANPATSSSLSASRAAGVAPPMAAATQPALQTNELSVSCTDRTPPVYPRLSSRLGEQGKTVLLVELDEIGRVANVVVKTGSGFPRLDEAAVNAVKSWRCTPARRNGVAVRSFAMQPFNFALKGR